MNREDYSDQEWWRAEVERSIKDQELQSPEVKKLKRCLYIWLTSVCLAIALGVTCLVLSEIRHGVPKVLTVVAGPLLIGVAGYAAASAREANNSLKQLRQGFIELRPEILHHILDGLKAKEIIDHDLWSRCGEKVDNGRSQMVQVGKNGTMALTNAIGNIVQLLNNE